MVLAIQVVGTLFGLFMIYYTFLHYKRNEITIKESSFWIFLWLLFILVALFPQLLDPIVASLSLARTMDFFIILGFLFLIGIAFYTYILVRKNQKRLDTIVRKLALEKK